MYSDKGQTGTFNIGTLKISAKDSSYGLVSGIVTLSNVKYSDVAVGDSQIQVSFVNGSNNSNTDNNSSNNNSNNGNSGNNTSGLNNSSNSSINNPKTSDFKIGLIISLIAITLIISILGYKRLKKLLKN